MNIKELFKKVKRSELIDYLISNYYNDFYLSENLEIDQEILKENINRTIESFINKESKQDVIYNDFFIFVTKCYDCLSFEEKPETMFDVFGCYKKDIQKCYSSKNETTKPVFWGIDFIERCFLVDLEIASNCIELYGDITVAGEIFWEITFYGDEESTVEEFKNELNERCKEIDSNKNNFKSLDINEFFKSIDPEYVPFTEQELKEQDDKVSQYIEENNKIYDNLFINFLK